MTPEIGDKLTASCCRLLFTTMCYLRYSLKHRLDIYNIIFLTIWQIYCFSNFRKAEVLSIIFNS